MGKPIITLLVLSISCFASSLKLEDCEKAEDEDHCHYSNIQRLAGFYYTAIKKNTGEPVVVTSRPEEPSGWEGTLLDSYMDSAAGDNEGNKGKVTFVFLKKCPPSSLCGIMNLEGVISFAYFIVTPDTLLMPIGKKAETNVMFQIHLLNNDILKYGPIRYSSKVEWKAAHGELPHMEPSFGQGDMLINGDNFYERTWRIVLDGNRDSEIRPEVTITDMITPALSMKHVLTKGIVIKAVEPKSAFESASEKISKLSALLGFLGFGSIYGLIKFILYLVQKRKNRSRKASLAQSYEHQLEEKI